MLGAKLKAFLPLFVVANSISWFLLTMVTIMQLPNDSSFRDPTGTFYVFSVPYFVALLFAALIGATLLAQKLKEKLFLTLWIIWGVLSSFLTYFFLVPQTNWIILGVISFILGGSVGLGIPVCLSMFSNQTKNEQLGRIGAALFFVIQIMTAIILFSIGESSIDYKFLIFSIWRILGLIGIFFLIEIKNNDKERKLSLLKILRDRTFILYFLPWFMFTLINFMLTPLVKGYMGFIDSNYYSNYELTTFVITSFTAIVAGFLCDFKGRKATGIIGFVLLGIGYTFLSLIPQISAGSGMIAIVLFTVFDGLAWGFLYVNFVFVVWGDLSEKSNREKYYFLGGMPFLFSGLIRALAQYLNVQTLEISTAFSLASFFLFIATVPLLYAPESLSEKLMKSRELFNYVNMALKKVQKEKGTPPEQNREKDEDEIEAEETPEEIEARKLAEKYY
jgi:MFS family permease